MKHCTGRYLNSCLEARHVVQDTHVLVPGCEHVLARVVKQQARDGLRVHLV